MKLARACFANSSGSLTTKIADIVACEIIDGRCNPTVKVDATFDNGSMGGASVPSGASTGAHETMEMRDGSKR